MTRSIASLKLALVVAVAAATLAGCSSNNEETPIGASPKPAAPSNDKVNTPLKPEQVSASASVLEGPYYDAASDQLIVKIAVKNTGSVVYPVTGINAVTLGVVQKVPGQGGQPDMRASDTRAAFKEDIKPGATGEADVSLPADFAVAHKVEFEPLQENVVWFGYDLKQPTAVIGPFARCADGKGLCDGQGNPVPAK